MICLCLAALYISVLLIRLVQPEKSPNKHTSVGACLITGKRTLIFRSKSIFKATLPQNWVKKDDQASNLGIPQPRPRAQQNCRFSLIRRTSQLNSGADKGSVPMKEPQALYRKVTLKRLWARQSSSTEAGGADAFSEVNPEISYALALNGSENIGFVSIEQCTRVCRSPRRRSLQVELIDPFMRAPYQGSPELTTSFYSQPAMESSSSSFQQTGISPVYCLMDL